MKKAILAIIAGIILSPITQAVQVVCPADWQSQYGCGQCFQFYLTEADLGFTSNDHFIPRGTLENGQKEILWIDQSTITGHAMQGAQIGPTGNIKHLYSFPSSSGTHSSNSQNYAEYSSQQSNVWAQMNGGSGIGVSSFGNNLDSNQPVYRIEYTTVSEVASSSGDILGNSQATHKECAMYMYAGLNAASNPGIEISVTDNNDGTITVTVTNTGDVPVKDVDVRHSALPECNDHYDLILAGMSKSKLCTLRDITGGNNNIDAEGEDPDGNPVRDSHSHTTNGAGDLLIIVEPYTGGPISGEAGIGPSYKITVKNIGRGRINDVSVRTGIPGCDRSYPRLEEGAQEQYICHTGGHGPGPYVADGKGYLPNGKPVTYKAHFGKGPAGTCSLKTDRNHGTAPLTVNASVVCSHADLLRGKGIYISAQDGTPITKYDSYGHAHTFRQPGSYIISCLELRNPASLNCQQRIQVTLSCGNGVIETGEQCDDGNQASGDGCSHMCLQEMCGNGVIDAGEQCDDGNNTNNDQCSNLCQTGTPDAGPGGTIMLLLSISISLVAGGFLVRRRYT